MIVFIAYGYDVTDDAIMSNGKEERYCGFPASNTIFDSWEYTHKLHDKKAYITQNGVGVCPKCGQFALIKIKQTPLSELTSD
jgi:hypothetical protein